MAEGEAVICLGDITVDGEALAHAERVEALATEGAGQPIDELGSGLRGRMRRPENGERTGTIVWRIDDDGGDGAIAAHRITGDEVAAIADLVNAHSIETLAARAHDPRACRGLSAATRAAGLRA